MLKLEDFKKVDLRFSKLRNITGGSERTTEGSSQVYTDFIDDAKQTKFDCDETLYNDGC